METNEKIVLDTIYKEEIESGIGQIEAALQAIDSNGRFDENIKTVLNSCMHIMDLGMIHGYEGVEAIAEMMFNAARYCSRQGSATLDETREKLNSALSALKEVVRYSDESDEQAIVDKTRTAMDFQIDTIQFSGDEQEEQEEWHEPARSNLHRLSSQKLPFEIKEFTAIPVTDLSGGHEDEQDVEEARGSDKPESGSELQQIDEFAAADILEQIDEAEDTPDFDYIQAFEEGEVRIVDDVLDSISAAQIVQAADKIDEAIQNYRENIEPELALQDVRDSLAELKNTTREPVLQPVSELLFPLERIGREHLENDETREEALDLIVECNRVVRAFAEQQQVSSATLLTLKEKINHLQKMLDPEDQLSLFNVEFEEDFEEPEILPPPKQPLIARIRRFFGMY